MKSKYKIAIIGLGSIGKRHLFNIVSILQERSILYTIDLIRSNKGNELDKEIKQIINQVFYSDQIVSDDYDIIFITNPTHLHFETIKNYTTKTKHMFIEKPLTNRIDISISELGPSKDGIYYVACPLRYSDVIQYIKNNCMLNKVYCARVICSSFLPDWRPNQDYRTSYSAHEDEGGGVAIDLIHEWDYICYLFGYPDKVFRMSGKFSDLDIDSDDLSVYIAKYRNMIANIHLDYFGRKIIREIQLFTSEDTIVGDIANSEVRYLKSGKTISFKENRNDFHRKELAYFFDILSGKEVNHNDIVTAFKTLKIAKVGY